MNWVEAFTAVENSLSTLNLKDMFGEKFVGIEAVGFVMNFHGERWDELNQQAIDQTITPEQYVERAKQMISEFAEFKFKQQMLNKLKDLRLDQVELDLVSGGV